MMMIVVVDMVMIMRRKSSSRGRTRRALMIKIDKYACICRGDKGCGGVSYLVVVT